MPLARESNTPKEIVGVLGDITNTPSTKGQKRSSSAAPPSLGKKVKAGGNSLLQRYEESEAVKLEIERQRLEVARQVALDNAAAEKERVAHAIANDKEKNKINLIVSLAGQGKSMEEIEEWIKRFA